MKPDARSLNCTYTAMLRGTIVTCALASCTAFAPSSLHTHTASLRGSARASTLARSTRMQVSTPSAPVDIFKDMDADGQDVRTSPFLKESEVKHGRLAMLAAIGYPAAELIHPVLAESAGLPNLLTEAGQAPSVVNGGLESILAIPGGLFLVMFVLGRAWSVEQNALRPRNNFISKNPKEQFPYDLGFDPLGFYTKFGTESQRSAMRNAEIYNGRLAMLAISAYPFIEMGSKSAIVKAVLASQE